MRGSLAAGNTVHNTKKAAARLISASPKFHAALINGQYAYFECHYCLDSKAYMRKSHYSGRRLTDYARVHIDECCVSFSVSCRYAKAAFSEGYAARKTNVTDKYQSRHVFEVELESKERVVQNDHIKTDAALWGKLRRELPHSFGKAVQLILEEKGISRSELTLRLCVSRAAVRKCCDERATLRHVVALCTLDVRTDICEELVSFTSLIF